MAEKKTKRVRFENVGTQPVFTHEAKPGWNVLGGGNGAGKSLLIDFISRAAGDDVAVQILDGENRARLIVDDGVVCEVTRTRSKRAGSEVNVSLASVSSLVEFVDPQLVDPERNEARRIQALLKMTRLKTTRETIETMVMVEGEPHDGALDTLDDEEGLDRLCELDPFEASVKVGRALHKRKRELNTAADVAQGQWLAAHPEKPLERESGLTVEQADKFYRDAVGNHRQTEGEASQRMERERQIEALKTAQFVRPNLGRAETEVKDADTAFVATIEEIARLKAELKAAVTSAEEAGLVKSQTEERLRLARAMDAQWLRNKELLDSEIAGATDADVETAAARVQEAATELELARATEEYRKRKAAAEEARQSRDDCSKLATTYEALATGVSGKLGTILEGAGISSLTVDEGIINFVHPDGHLEEFRRLSQGERWRIALPIYIPNAPGRIIGVPFAAYAGMEPESRVEVERLLIDNDVIAYTELPTHRGDPLHVEETNV